MPNSKLNSSPQAQIQPADFEAPSGRFKPSGFKWNWRHSLILAAGIGALLIVFFMVSAKALRISTNAEDTEISLRGGAGFPLGNGRYLVIKGNYRLSLSAGGYHPRTLDLEINSDTLSNLNFELAALPGQIRAKFAMESPQRADMPVKGRVHLNGSSMEPANELLFKDLEQGTYQLEADAYLYAPETIEVDVRGREITEEITLDLNPNWATLTFEVYPQGAALFAGSQKLMIDASQGEVKSSLVEAGRARLNFRYPGYKTWESDIEIAADERLDLGRVRLEPVDTRYSITTVPAGVSVTVDGQYAGQTPITLDLLPETEHQLKLFKAGYISQEHPVNLAKNSETSGSFNLQADLIDVVISVLPASAQVFVDGVIINDRGKTGRAGSHSMPMSSIKHSIEVKADGYASQTLDFLPVKGSGQLVKVHLLTDEQAIWANTPGRYTGAVGNTMILFRDPGLVAMGSSRSEPGRRANEIQWNARLSRAFYVSTTEITNKQYRMFQSEHSSGHYETQGLDGPERPAVSISWQKAALYCNWLSEKSGLEPFYTVKKGFVSGSNPQSTGYRLLTEAEWAFLAKITPSGLPQRYIWGNSGEVPQKFENFADQSIAHKINFVLADNNDGFPVSSPVASFDNNAKGIYDLGGNVMEWVHDWYQPIPYETNTEVTDPLGPEEGEFHVIRGASWARGYLPQLRLAYRDYDSKGRNDLGFRIARYAI